MMVQRPNRIVVPCFNEERRLPVDGLRAFADTHPDLGFVLVDDGSTDGTRRVLEALAREAPEAFTVLCLEENRGKGEAVRAGLRHALQDKPSVVGYWDADLATPLEAIPEMLALLADRPDVGLVMGARVKLLGRQVQRDPMRHYAGRIVATLLSFLLDLRVYDTQCGAKLLRADDALARALADPFFSRWLFDVELLSRLMRERGASAEVWCVEYPLRRWRDVAGSKVGLRDFPRVGGDLLRLWWRYGAGRHRS